MDYQYLKLYVINIHIMTLNDITISRSDFLCHLWKVKNYCLIRVCFFLLITHGWTPLELGDCYYHLRGCFTMEGKKTEHHENVECTIFENSKFPSNLVIRTKSIDFKVHDLIVGNYFSFLASAIEHKKSGVFNAGEENIIDCGDCSWAFLFS